jgi:hypothetical protein
MLSVWRGALHQDAIATHFLVAGELRRKYVRFGLMVVVEEDSPPPQVDGRRALGELYRQLSPNLLGVALVIRGQGFLLSAARALMSAVLAPYQFPSRIFADPESAIPWMSNYVTQRHHFVTRDDLGHLITSAYEQYTWRRVEAPRRLAV